MESGRSQRQLSRSMRESMAGLMLLGASVLVFLFLFGWLRNFPFLRQSYEAVVEFDSASGITTGTAVTYRGVNVGSVVEIEPQPEGVEVTISINPGDRRIPSDAVVQAKQSSLVGSIAVDIMPLSSLPQGKPIAAPLDANCDTSIIICNGSRLKGYPQLDFEQLTQSVVKVANVLTDPTFTNRIDSLANNASDAFEGVSSLSRDVTELKAEVKQVLGGAGVNNVNSTLQSVRQAATEVQSFAATNRTALLSTLNNFQETSDRVRGTLTALEPVLQQTDIRAVVRNLEVMSANAAEVSTNLRDLSTRINDPGNAVELQQLLDAARSVFQNIDKITSDLDALTGDPQLRQRIRDLINGLSRLVSTTQNLQRQAQVAQAIDTLSQAAQPVPLMPTPPAISATQEHSEGLPSPSGTLDKRSITEMAPPSPESSENNAGFKSGFN